MVDLNELYDDQKEAYLRSIFTIFNNPHKTEFVLSGCAGSGKSVTLSKVVETLKLYLPENHFSVCCPTNRAALSLMKKINESTPKNEKPFKVSTIHSHLYDFHTEVRKDSDGNEYQVLISRERPLDEVRKSIGDILILDESSMVNSEMIKKLREIDINILFVGDRNQLPPVHEKESILEHSDFSLENIYRTDHQDIMSICNSVKSFNKMFPQKYRDSDEVSFVKFDSLSTTFFEKNDFDAIICGTHKTRNAMNEKVRIAKGFDDKFPMKGEKVICKKNGVSNNDRIISNGDILTVKNVFGSNYILVGDHEDDEYLVTINDNNFIPQRKKSPDKGYQLEFDFAYAITTHVSQGSTFNRVLFIDENVGFFLPQQKFRYTAMTRTAEHLTIALLK